MICEYFEQANAQVADMENIWTQAKLAALKSDHF